MPGKSKRKGEPKESGAGRPTLLTPKVHKLIIDAVELLGMTEGRAALAYGISPAAITRWKQRGIESEKVWDKLTEVERKVELRYIEFINALREAEPKFEMANLTIIQNAAAQGDWRAARDRLALKMPHVYGKRVMVANDPKNPMPSIPVLGAVIILPDNHRVRPSSLVPAAAPEKTDGSDRGPQGV